MKVRLSPRRNLSVMVSALPLGAEHPLATLRILRRPEAEMFTYCRLVRLASIQPNGSRPFSTFQCRELCKLLDAYRLDLLVDAVPTPFLIGHSALCHLRHDATRRRGVVANI